MDFVAHLSLVNLSLPHLLIYCLMGFIFSFHVIMCFYSNFFTYYFRCSSRRICWWIYEICGFCNDFFVFIHLIWYTKFKINTSIIFINLPTWIRQIYSIIYGWLATESGHCSSTAKTEVISVIYSVTMNAPTRLDYLILGENMCSFQLT